MTIAPRIFVTASALTAALLLAGCAGPGSSRSAAQTDPRPGRQSGLTIDHNAWSRLGYQWDWTGAPYVAEGANIAIVTPTESDVIVADSANFFTVLEPNSGDIRWAAQLERRIARYVGVVPIPGGETFWAVGTGKVQEIELRSGNTVREQALGMEVTTEPVIAGDKLIFGTGSGGLLAHNVTTAFKSWAYQLDGAIDANPVEVAPGLVATVSRGGDVATHATETGSMIARAKIAGGVEANPISDGDLVYVASLDQSVYAFEAESGRRVWRHRTPAPIVVQPTLWDGLLYVSLEQGLTALDAFTGDVVWQNTDIQGWVCGTRDGELLVWNGLHLMLIDADRGDLIDSVDVPGAIGIKVDRFEDPDVYVVTTTRVARFRPR